MVLYVFIPSTELVMLIVRYSKYLLDNHVLSQCDHFMYIRSELYVPFLPSGKMPFSAERCIIHVMLLSFSMK